MKKAEFELHYLTANSSLCFLSRKPKPLAVNVTISYGNSTQRKLDNHSVHCIVFYSLQETCSARCYLALSVM